MIPHGIAPRFFRPGPVTVNGSSPGHVFRWLYVSAIDSYKHQVEVAKAATLVRSRQLPLSVEFIGHPRRPEEVRRFHTELERIDPGCEFLRYSGVVPFESIDQRYRAADGFVFASACESFGFPLAEAMASGLPIVCSNRGPIPTILGDGGLYFDPEKPAEIAAAMRKMQTDASCRQRLAARARELAQAYSWEQCTRKTFAFVREACRGTSR